MFLGRQRELDALRRAIDVHDRVRIWGPSGVGKTRLAREAFPKAIFVDLTASRSDEVARTIARVLEIEDDAFVELAVERRLGDDATVVLDGVDACEEVVAELCARWSCRVVMTSRRAGEEHAIELGPLALEHALELWRSRVDPSDPDLAERIVERLDRLPLALEWVSARAPLLGEAGCLERIERFEGDPLMAALDESLAACSPEERAALEAIVAFPRGVPIAMLERVGTIEVIEALRRRSLVLRVDERVRAYHAVARRVRATMSDARRTETRALHAAVMVPAEDPTRRELLDLREDLEQVAAGGDLRACLLALPLRMSEGELSIARERLEAHADDPRAALGLASLERRAGNLDVARRWAKRVSAKSDAFDAQLELAQLDRLQSRLDDARSRLEALLEDAADDRERCIALGEVGRLLQSAGRHRDARARHVDAIALCRALGWETREALERSLHARATHRGGDVREAIGLHERALEMHRALSDRRLAAAELGHLGFCHHELGNHEEAERCFRESIEGLGAAGDVVLEHIERVLLARLLGDLGRFAEAHLELGIAASIDRAVAMPRLEHTRLYVRAWILLAEGRRDEALADLDAAAALGVHVEVGFEALLDATVGALRGRPAKPIVAESPALVAASEALASMARGEAPTIDAELRASSSDLRRIARLEGRAPTLRIARDGSQFAYGDVHADLKRRNAPRRILRVLTSARLDEPGRACTRDALIEAGWPGEKMLASAADKRLRTAIWTLRKAGLEPVLLTRDEGYLLDPAVPTEWR